MKGLRCACLLVLAALLSASGAGCADARVAPPPRARMQATQWHHAAKLPASVDVYAATDIGHGWQCEVGAKLVGDVLQELPVIYLDRVGHGFAWHAQLRIPKHFYQGRATHCVASDNRVYVLVQFDTDSQRSLNETVLRVIELNKDTGKLVRTMEIDVPHLSASFYTSWVDKGADNFTLEGDKLVIRGKYELMSEWNSTSGEPHPFMATIPTDLNR